MKRFVLTVAAGLLLAGLSSSVTAALLVRDTFDVGTSVNNDANDPDDVSWTAFQGGTTLTITNDGVFSGRSLDVNPGANAARGLNGALPRVIHLGVGESLSFSFRARIMNPGIATTNTFRFGLFFGVDAGYAAFLPINAAGNLTIQVDGPPDTSPGDNNPASGGDLYSLGAAPFSGIFDTGIYDFSITLTRSATNRLEVSASAADATVAATHLTPTNGFRFDRMIIRNGPNASNTNRFRVDDIQVTYTQVTPKIDFVSTYGSSNTVTVHFSAPVSEPTGAHLANYAYEEDGVMYGFSAARFIGSNSLVALTAEAGRTFVPGKTYTLFVAGVENELGEAITVDNGVVTFTQVVARALFEQFLNLSGSTFPPPNAEKFTNTAPDLVTFRPNFNWSGSGNMEDSWLGRLSAWFVPPSNGTYRFYIRSDDSSRLYLNTNAVNSTDPTGKTLIALLNGNRGFYTNWPSGDAAVSGPIDLVGGQRYYLEALVKEGAAGDNFFLTVRDNNTLTNPPSSETVNSAYIELPFGDAGVSTITPAAVTNAEFTTATFTISGLSGAGPLAVQWQRNGTNIPGANGYTFTTLPLEAGDTYRCLVWNPFSVAEISPVITVLADTNPPVLLGAAFVWEAVREVLVTFSELLDPVSANAATNYQIAGHTIVNTTLQPNGSSVVLELGEAPADGAILTLSVSGVKDRSGRNEVAPGSTAICVAPVVQPGFLRREFYANITGSAVANLTGDSNYLVNPSWVGLSGAAATPDNIDENFGQRLSGYFIPPETGLYNLYICSDNASELWMNTNALGSDSPRGAVRLCREDSYNGGRTWTGDRAGGTRGNPPVNIASNVFLNAGQRYYVNIPHKEGGGGDNLGVTWKRPSDPGHPANGAPTIITSAFIAAVSPPAIIVISRQPTNQEVIEYRTATFTVQAFGFVSNALNPSNLVALYQWQKGDGFGGFTDIPGATASTYTTPVLTPADDQSQFRVVVTVPGAVTNSETATVTVLADGEPPQVLSVGSADGLQIGITFNELIDATSAGSINNYSVNVGTAAIERAAVRPDGRSVILKLYATNPVTGAFTVEVANVADRSGNVMGFQTLSGVVLGYTVQDLGAPLAPGGHFVSDTNRIELVGGGADIWGTSDAGHILFRELVGDFDVRVRVEDLSMATTVANSGTIAKAGLIARETTNADSRTIHLLANPLPPGRNLIEAGVRQTTGGGTSAWGTNQTANMPNCWLRLTRTGDAFAGYRSTNGQDWILFAATNQTDPAALLVGLTVTAHTNYPSLLVTGTFSGLTIIQPGADLALTKLDAPDPVAAGAHLTYTLLVTNLGPNPATGVVVTDTLPAGVSFGTASASQGTWTQALGMVTFDLGTISAGASATATIVVSPTAPGTFVNTASVTSAVPDPDPANNTATTSTLAPVAPALTLWNYTPGGGLDLEFSTEIGATYVVEYKNDLSATNWAVLATIIGDGTVKPVSDPNPPADKRFYRVRVP